MKQPTSSIEYAKARLTDPRGYQGVEENAKAFGLGQILSSGIIALEHYEYEKARADRLDRALKKVRRILEGGR